MKFSNLLNHRLKSTKTTGTDLAKHLGIANSSMHAIQTGKTLPRKERLDEMFKFLKLTPEEEKIFRDAFQRDKSTPKPKRTKPSPKTLEQAMSLLKEREIHASTPFHKLEEPDLFFQHYSTLGIERRVGIWLTQKKIHWDTVFAVSMRMKQLCKLDDVIFLFTEKSGMASIETPDHELFQFYNIHQGKLEALGPIIDKLCEPQEPQELYSAIR